jgi:hypothetical protein
MGDNALSNHDELMQRLQRELLDSYDEELEMEIEDRDVEGGLTGSAHPMRCSCRRCTDALQQPQEPTQRRRERQERTQSKPRSIIYH